MGTEKIWEEYVTYLREHVPAAHANLAPGATDAAITQLEETIGLALPDSLKTVWRLNDGQRETMIADEEVTATPCVPTLSFLSTDRVAHVWQTWAKLRASTKAKDMAALDAMASSAVEGVVKPIYSSPKWIPIWGHPTNADYIGLDFDPGPAGRAGQVITFGRDEENHWQCADDFEDLLQFLIEEIRTGTWQASTADLGGEEDVPWFGGARKSFFNTLRRRWEQRYAPDRPAKS